jgi:hypothetical protein
VNAGDTTYATRVTGSPDCLLWIVHALVIGG